MAKYPKHIRSSVKHGGSNVMTWACMAAGVTNLQMFIDDVTSDRRRIWPNAAKWIGQCFTMQIDNDPKHSAKATQKVGEQ